MFGHKGQESAPFELLIAIIVMTFVSLFAARAIDEMLKEDCRAKINQQLERMRTAIESTTNNSSQEKINFRMPGCFNESRVELNPLRDKYICSNICKEGREQCVLLDYFSPAYVRRVCVNIPMNTMFEGTADGLPGTYCPDKRKSVTGEPIGYKLIPLTHDDVGVPNGVYTLTNRTPPGTSFPVVCAYILE